MSSLSKQRSRGRAHVSALRSPLTRPSPLISLDGPGHALRWAGSQIRTACYQRTVRRCGDQTNTIPLGQSSYEAYQHDSRSVHAQFQKVHLAASNRDAVTHAHTHTHSARLLHETEVVEILCKNKVRWSR